MSSASSVAATLRPETRQQIAIEALAKSTPISHLAIEYEVSRKFIYQQSDQAKRSLDESFEPTTPAEQVLFHLPITKAWLFQLILGLVLICHSSLRGVVELLRDVFDIAISASTVRNRLTVAAEQASTINAAQDLSRIEVDLRDEIFQARRPVLVGIDAASTYCYLLELAEHRDADTWVLGDSGIGLFRAFGEAQKLRGHYRSALLVIYPCNFSSLCYPAPVYSAWIATQSNQGILHKRGFANV
jgi:hypothetical protein